MIGQLVDSLIRSRPLLRTVQYRDVLRTLSEGRIGTRGAIGETMVQNWLMRTPGVLFDYESPRVSQSGLYTSPYGEGVRVHSNTGGNRSIIEYDFVIDFNGTGFMAEVKSVALNGYESRVDRAAEIAVDFLGPRSGLVVFVPFNGKGVEQFSKHPNVAYISMGYGLDDLEKYIGRMRSWKRKSQSTGKRRKRRGKRRNR